MKSNRTKVVVGICAAVGATLCVSAPAQALSDYGDVVATWLGNNATGRPAPAEDGGVFAFTRDISNAADDFGQILVTNSPENRFIGFCLEVGEFLNTNKNTYTVRDVADAPIDSLTTMGVTRAEDIAKLVTLALGGRLSNALLPAFSANVLPFQIALWEISQDRLTTRGAYSLATGSYMHAANAIATGWLTTLNGVNTVAEAAGLYALTNGGGIPAPGEIQDQLVQVVPIPAAAWLLGSGLLGLFGLARRKNAAVAP